MSPDKKFEEIIRPLTLKIHETIGPDIHPTHVLEALAMLAGGTILATSKKDTRLENVITFSKLVERWSRQQTQEQCERN